MPGTRRTVTANASATTTQLRSTRRTRLTAGSSSSWRHPLAPLRGPTRALRLGVSLACRLFHLLAQAQRPHVRPHLVDVLEAVRLRALLAHLPPTGGRLGVGEPNGVLLPRGDDHLVGPGVLFVFW